MTLMTFYVTQNIITRHSAKLTWRNLVTFSKHHKISDSLTATISTHFNLCLQRTNIHELVSSAMVSIFHLHYSSILVTKDMPHAWFISTQGRRQPKHTEHFYKHLSWLFCSHIKHNQCNTAQNMWSTSLVLPNHHFVRYLWEMKNDGMGWGTLRLNKKNWKDILRYTGLRRELATCGGKKTTRRSLFSAQCKVSSNQFWGLMHWWDALTCNKPTDMNYIAKTYRYALHSNQNQSSMVK